MSRRPTRLAIDARPIGPRGPLAFELVRGRTVLDRMLDDVSGLVDAGTEISVIVRHEDEGGMGGLLARRTGRPHTTSVESPTDGCPVLRTDRLYDLRRLRRVLRSAKDPESAVFWRLDTPQGLAGAGDELIRRKTFQPLGHYWALGPARSIARALAPTRVRPNAVTLVAASLVLTAAALVGFSPAGMAGNLLAASALALALVLDTADGHLARLQGTSSAFGRWLDGWLDEVGDMALHGAAAWAAFTRSGSAVWLVAGMVYAMGKFLFVAATLESGEKAPDGQESKEDASPSLTTRFVRAAGHADIRWHLWIVLAAAGRMDVALVAYAVYFPARAVAVAVRKGVRHGE